MKILITLVVVEFLVSAVPVSGDYAWYTHDILTHARVAALAAWVTSLIDYRQLALRCCLGWYTVAEVLHILTEIWWYFFDAYLPYLDWLRVGVALVVMAWYLYRQYEIPSDPLDGRHVFIVRRKPSGVQDWLLSMVGRATGGTSVYCRGFWYHYRHGEFVKSDKSELSTRLDRHVIIKSKRCDDEFVALINSIVGTRWTLIHNCMTLVLPVAVLRRRVPWMPGRRES